MGELDRVDAMLVAVILDGQHEILPPHVEVVLASAVRAQHGYLRLRAWEAVANQEEPQPRFPRRGRTSVNKAERLLELAQAAGVTMPASQLLHSGHLEVRSAGECVKALNRTANAASPADVERRALGRRYRETVESLNLLPKQQVVPGHNSLRLSRVAPDQFNRCVVVHPLGSVQRRGRDTGH